MTAERIFDFAREVAVVTGASSGSGRRAAQVLAERGAWNASGARRMNALDEWAAGCDRIVNFALPRSRRAFAGGIAYGASKVGTEQMTRAMGEVWSGDGIDANAPAPGFVPHGLLLPSRARDDATGQVLFMDRGYTAR